MCISGFLLHIEKNACKSVWLTFLSPLYFYGWGRFWTYINIAVHLLFIKIALKIESIINLLFLYHRVDVAL